MPQTYFVVETSQGPQSVLRQGKIQTFDDAVLSLRQTMYGSEGRGVPIPSQNYPNQPPATIQEGVPNIADKGAMLPGDRAGPNFPAEVLRGLTAGLSEEGLSAIKGATGDLPFSEGFDQAQAYAHAQRAATQEMSPGGAFAAEALGGAIPAAKALRGVHGARQAVRRGKKNLTGTGGAALTGGIQGGIYGAMEDEDDRMAGAQKGATTGIAAGAAIQGGGRLLGGAIKPVIQKMARRKVKRGDVRSKAERATMLRLEKEGNWKTGEDIADEMAEDLNAYEATGVMGERITKTAMRKGEKGVQEAADRIGSFRRNQYQRFKDLAKSVFGSRELWLQQKQKWIDERVRLGDKYYDRIFKNNIWKGPSTELRGELDNIVQYNPEVLKAAKKVANAARRPFAEKKIIGPNPKTGKLGVVRHPSLEEWEMIRRGFASLREKAFRKGDTPLAMELKKREQKLRKMLDDRAPELQRVRKRYSSAHDMSNALKEGETWGRSSTQSPTEVVAAWKNMSASERKHALWGYGEGLRDRIGGMKDSADVSKAVFTTPNSREILETILPDAKQRTAFMSRIGREQRKASKGAKLGDTAGSGTDLYQTEGAKSRWAALSRYAGKGWRNTRQMVLDMMAERQIPVEYNEHVLDIMLNTPPKEIARMFNKWTKGGTNARVRSSVSRELDKLLQGGGAMGVSSALAVQPTAPKAPPTKQFYERIE